jgi:hypothetical protein
MIIHQFKNNLIMEKEFKPISKEEVLKVLEAYFS